MKQINGFSMISNTRMEECKIHGPHESVLISSTWFGCPACEAADRAKRTAAERAQEAERKRLWARSRLLASGIPTRFCDATIDGYIDNDPDQTAVKQIARRYVADFSHGRASNILLVGNVGTGKTHLGCAMLSEIHRTTRASVHYATMPKMTDSVKATFSAGADETAAQIVARYVNADLFMLDEVGVLGISEFERGVLYSVIDGRYVEKRPTILASNLNMELLSPLLGDRIIDRLRDDGGKVVPFTWKSARG